ncbi:MAG: hypothetical protein HYS04_06280 [Acidobacteria bacterium]|nr:hypothetical protein [Acidobacteriota bacterium]
MQFSRAVVGIWAAAGLCLAAEKPARQPRAAAAPAMKVKPAPQPAPKSEPNGLPAGAVRVDEYRWRHKGEDGRSWIYRQTPFGFSKIPEDGAEPAGNPFQGGAAGARGPSPAAEVPVKVTEEGDQVRFERASPFGPQVWVKKKSELSDAERRWLEASQSRSGK